MTPRDFFGLAVRIFGFWYLLGGVFDVLTKTFPYLQYFRLHTFNPPSAFDVFSSAVVSILLGAALLLYADKIVRLMYRPAP